MKKGLEQLIQEESATLIPLNFFNAVISPFTQDDSRTDPMRQIPTRISCPVLQDNNILKQVFYKNTSSVYYDTTKK